MVPVRVRERDVRAAHHVAPGEGLRATEAVPGENGVLARHRRGAVHVAVRDGGVVAADGEIAVDDAEDELRVVLVDRDVAFDADPADFRVVLLDVHRAADDGDGGAFAVDGVVVASERDVACDVDAVVRSVDDEQSIVSDARAAGRPRGGYVRDDEIRLVADDVDDLALGVDDDVGGVLILALAYCGAALRRCAAARRGNGAVVRLVADHGYVAWMVRHAARERTGRVAATCSGRGGEETTEQQARDERALDHASS